MRRRCKVLEKRKRIKHHGWYEENGAMVKVWGIGHAGPNLAHSVELLDIALLLNVDDILVSQWIPKDWRHTFDPDMVITSQGTTFFIEHDRATEDLAQITRRMDKLADCPFAVLWVCPDDDRIGVLLNAAPNDRHWFTTMDQLAHEPHGPVWENTLEQAAAIPQRFADGLHVQSRRVG